MKLSDVPYDITCLLFLSLSFLSSDASAVKNDWKEYRASHFIIYHNHVPEDFLKTVENAAENYYQEIATNLGFTRYKSWSWEERARIYIYDDADDYARQSWQVPWSSGAAFSHGKVIQTFPAAHGFFDSTLPHELGHIIFREFVGDGADVPRWFEEGVAMYQEKARRWGSSKQVSEAIKNGQFIPLSKLTHMRLYNDSSQETVQLFYAEAASIVYYMITELGAERFVRLCRQLKDGRPFEAALKETYARFITLDDLNKAWVDSL